MFCKKCKEYVGSRGLIDCKCKPFTVYDENEEESTIHSTSMDDAALAWAKERDGCEHGLVGEEVEIRVINSFGKTKSYRVGAEPDIHYSANEV